VGDPNPRKFDCYVPRVLLTRLATAPEELVQKVEGTVVFADVSGFTRLSERLARVGKEGAEHLVDTINACFSALLADAYAHGGSLLKFGGDALLLWFEGTDHAIRACASAALMRSTLRRIGRIDTRAGKVVVRMSVGVHSGWFETFLVGDSNREYLIAGPAASRAVAIEAAASTGQILLSRETAAMLPRSCLGRAAGPGVLLGRVPPVTAMVSDEQVRMPPEEAVALCLSTGVRAHVSAAPVTPEHRIATVAFVQFGGLDEQIDRDGPRAAAEAVDELVRAVQEGADLFQVCLLQSDIAADGAKFQLTAGAPRALGDDEERMLLAVRHVIDCKARLPVRIGVSRGHIFTGEIGPPYRRTCAVMGDATNLAARLMTKAPWGSIYATEGVLERSQTSFQSTAVAPFTVKGKLRPVQAVGVGPIRRPVREAAAETWVPLVGRDRELAKIRDAVVGARAGRGSMVEIVGETGSGKSRLLTKLHELAGGFCVAHTICENYRRTVPYVVWRDILRQLLGLHWDDPDDVVGAAIVARIEAGERDLLPWLPLLAIAFDVQVPMMQEVRELAPDYRAAKLHEVVLQFLEPLLAVPTLVQIEHAQFMDEASSALLHAIAVRLDWSAWAITVTRRDVTDGFVAAPETSTQVTLGPLPAEAMMELAESTPEASVVPPHVLEMAVQRAGGSPEFLLDLLASASRGSGALPDSIDAAATARIDELDPRDRVLVRRASVLGLCFHRRLLGHVLESDVPEPDEETWSRVASVFADDGDGYVRFKRPALCEVAYESLPFRIRRVLHRAVAAGLEQRLGSDPDADPAVLSLHFMLAGENERAYRYALQGAERATARFSHADAATLYRRAIDAGRSSHVTPVELAAAWEGLGEALRHTGEPRAAAAALTEARRWAEDDPLAQARLFYRHAQIAQRSERLPPAVRWVGRGLRILEGLDSREATAQRARLLSALANIRQRQGRPVEAARLSRLAIAQAEPVGELRALAHASFVLDEALFESGRARAGEASNSIRALEIYERLGDLEQQHKVLNNMGGLAYFAGSWEEAIELYRRAADRSERAGKPADTAYSDCNIAEILSDQGHLEEAEAHLKRARRVWSSTGDRQGVAYANILLGRLAVRCSREEEGLVLLRGAEQELRLFHIDADADFAALLIAEAEALTGDAPRALAMSDRLAARADRSRALIHRLRGMALARLGRIRVAIEELEESLAAARQRGAEYDVAAAIDLLGSLGAIDPDLAHERDSILARLRIERLPQPRPAVPAAASAIKQLSGQLPGADPAAHAATSAPLR
jgi:class 3 adenylate cyclase/tetratricopeptide (TPR) repeat protein